MSSLFVKQNAIFLLFILNMFQSNNFVILTHLMLKDVYSYVMFVILLISAWINSTGPKYFLTNAFSIISTWCKQLRLPLIELTKIGVRCVDLVLTFFSILVYMGVRSLVIVCFVFEASQSTHLEPLFTQDLNELANYKENPEKMRWEDGHWR